MPRKSKKKVTQKMDYITLLIKKFRIFRSTLKKKNKQIYFSDDPKVSMECIIPLNSVDRDIIIPFELVFYLDLEELEDIQPKSFEKSISIKYYLKGRYTLSPELEKITKFNFAKGLGPQLDKLVKNINEMKFFTLNIT